MFARDRQTAPWVEQWARVDRWLIKLQAAYGADTPADEMMDLFYVFFQNLFSMRDWLLHSGIARVKVERLFSSRKLKICRDIVIGSKHCVIERPSVDAKIVTVRERSPELARAGSARTELFRVVANGQKIDLYGLAMLCVAEVQGFVLSEDLWGATSSPTCVEYCFGPNSDLERRY
jgi:hypothetical protein